MIEQELFKKHFLGRDGFVWWVGQIADATMWKTNQPGQRTLTNAEHKGFAERYRVRIMGYHTADKNTLPDNDLPWATVMYPVTAGAGPGTASESSQLRQGNFVFGFFMDGEEGQVPVIMGVIGINEYTAVLKNVPPVPFLPFDGYEKLDKRAQTAIKEQKEKVSGVQVKPPGTTPSDPQPAIQQSVVGQTQSNHLGPDKSQLLDGRQQEPEAKLRTDGTNQIKGLQLHIKNLVAEIERITRDIQKFGADTVSFRERVQKVIDAATKFVSEKVKWIVKELRKNTIERVNNAVKDTYFFFFPNERPNVKKTQDKALNGISCLFDNVIKGLFGLVGNFLSSLVSKIVNTAICVIENFVGGLIGKVAGFLSGALDQILGPLNSLLGLAGGIGSLSINVIGSVFDTIKSILGFFSCESKPAPQTTDQWSIWQGIGNNGGSGGSLSSIFETAREIGSQAITTATSVPSSITGAIQSLTFDDLFQDTCGVGPLLCGPPLVTFFGGGGSGATGNAIVSPTGNILGVDITNPGSGYVDSPSVYFDDPCGKGRGAVGKVILNTGSQTGTGLGQDATIIDSNLLGILGPGISEGSTPQIDIQPQENDGIIGTPSDISLVSSGTNYSSSSNVPTSGGSGTGLTVNIQVIDNPNLDEDFDIISGQVTNVSIYNPGENYRVGDIVTIENGTGATFRVDKVYGVDSGGIAKVIMTSPGTGYLSVPDGDAGGDGRVWNTKCQTVVRRANLDYERPFDPGQLITLNNGDTITLPVGTSVNISDANGTVIEVIQGGAPYVVTNQGTVTAPECIDGEIPLSAFPSLGNGQYPVVLELEEVYVKSSGFDYSSNDKVVMEPDLGAIFEPVFDKNGSVSKINIIRGAQGFADIPSIYVDSDTGYNAELVPVFKVNRVGDLPEDLDKVPRGQKVISVIDCVGKF